MNLAKPKLDALSSAAAQIVNANRRKIVENEIRPALKALSSDWNCFELNQDRFLRQVATLEIWATEIWKKRDGEAKVGKFLSELLKLKSQMKP